MFRLSILNLINIFIFNILLLFNILFKYYKSYSLYKSMHFTLRNLNIISNKFMFC